MPFEPDPSALARSPSVNPGRAPAQVAAEPAWVMVGRARTVLQQVEADPALLARLDLHGFGPAAIEAGSALVVAAETQIAAGEDAAYAHAALNAEREALGLAAREDYLEFRAAVRTVFAGRRPRRSLRVTGLLDPDLVGFVTQATASYRAAAVPAVAGRLAGRGFGRERIFRALESLEQLLELEQLVAAAARKRREAADERELAVRMLTLWTGELLKSLRRAFGRTARPPGGPRLVATGPDRGTRLPVRRLRRPGQGGV